MHYSTGVAPRPGPFFLTLGLREPRGSVRFGLGAASCAPRASASSFCFIFNVLVFISVLIAPLRLFQSGKLRHQFLPAVARKADGQLAVFAVVFAFQNRADAEFGMPHLAAQFPARGLPRSARPGPPEHSRSPRSRRNARRWRLSLRHFPKLCGLCRPGSPSLKAPGVRAGISSRKRDGWLLSKDPARTCAVAAPRKAPGGRCARVMPT